MWSHQSPSCSSAGSAGSQFSGFLPTKDHFSSNWTSRVSGGKSHELVVQLAGVVTGQPAVAHEVLATADAVVRTRGGQGAEAREVVHDVGNSWVSAVKSANLGNLTC